MRLSNLIASTLVVLVALATPAVADDFEFYQHDFEASKGSLSVGARVLSGDGGDYWHGQVDLALTDRLTVGARYADVSGVSEYRAHASYDVVQTEGFYVRTIGSYHYLDGGELIASLIEGGDLVYNGPESIDLWRLGVRVGVEGAIGENWRAFAWHEPRVVLSGELDDFQFVGSKSEAGLMRNFGPVAAGPFVQLMMDDGYQKNWLIAGTKVTAAF